MFECLLVFKCLFVCVWMFHLFVYESPKYWASLGSVTFEHLSLQPMSISELHIRADLLMLGVEHQHLNHIWHVLVQIFNISIQPAVQQLKVYVADFQTLVLFVLATYSIDVGRSIRSLKTHCLLDVYQKGFYSVWTFPSLATSVIGNIKDIQK